MLAITIPQGHESLVTGRGLDLWTWSADAVKIFGGSDSGSLLGAAVTLRDHGTIVPESRWVYSFWPPGMVVVDLVLLWAEKALNTPIVFLMVLINSALWATFLGTVFSALRQRFGFTPAAIFAAGALVSSAVSQWGTSSGLFYSDSFGAVAFCFSILFLILVSEAEVRRRRITYATLAGVSLAAACYFRASFELIADATLVLSIVVLVLMLLAHHWGALPRLTRAWLPAAKALTVMGLTAQVLLFPWRLIAGLKIHPGDFRWSAVSDLASAARWIPDSVLLKNGAGFAEAGHSNWACINDPVECDRVAELENATDAPYTGSGHFTGAEFDQLTLHSFLSHPLTYILERLDALTFGFLSNTGGSVKVYATPESLLLAAIFVATVVILIRSRSLWNPGYLFFLIATAIQLATLTLLHMEPRYFLAIELSIMLVGAFVLSKAARDQTPSDKSRRQHQRQVQQ